MALKLGVNSKLYRNAGSHDTPSWTEIANVKNLKLNLPRGEADVTTRAAAGYKVYLPTLIDASIEFQMEHDVEDENYLALRAAFFAGTAIEFAVMSGAIDASGSEGLRATMCVFEFTRNEELESELMHDVSIKPTYADNAPEYLVI